jgi:hypothetical protein
MAESDPHRRESRNASGQYRLWCCLLLVSGGSYAQDIRQPASLAGQSLTIAVTSDIAHSCGNTIPEPNIQQDVASQLRLANISIAKIHNAELSTEVDCTPARARSLRAREAVHYCVGLSQVIALPAAPRRHTLATTWRQCGSTTCTRGKCDALLRAEVRNLVTAFITYLHATGNSASSGPGPRLPQGTAGPAGEPTQAYASNNNSDASHQLADFPVPMTRSTVIYSLYILTCLGVLLQWEFRKHPLH